MLQRLPRHVPPAALLLADLGNPSAAELAAALGVSVRTVWRWQAGDEWPRLPSLALYFASRWGWSAVECDALRSVWVAQALCDSLRRDLATARCEVEHLAALSSYGCANRPLYAARLS